MTSATERRATPWTMRSLREELARKRRDPQAFAVTIFLSDLEALLADADALAGALADAERLRVAMEFVKIAARRRKHRMDLHMSDDDYFKEIEGITVKARCAALAPDGGTGPARNMAAGLATVPLGGVEGDSAASVGDAGATGDCGAIPSEGSDN